MKLIVISPEAEDAREQATLAQLFAAGLTDYHLRKPSWNRAQLAAFLAAVPEEFLPRIVLHTHHDLASEFAVGGLHHRDQFIAADVSGSSASSALSGFSSTSATPALASTSSSTTPAFFAGQGGASHVTLHSRAVHDMPSLLAALGTFDRVLVSPIFPSISKPGHVPTERLTQAAIASTLSSRAAIPATAKRTQVIALGGVELSRIANARSLGFDGVAVLGAIWQAADPIDAFNELNTAVRAA